MVRNVAWLIIALSFGISGCTSTKHQHDAIIDPAAITSPVTTAVTMLACKTTFARTFDGISARLAAAAVAPTSVSSAERNCLVGVAGQILKIYPLERSALSVSTTNAVAAVLDDFSQAAVPLDDARVYSGLLGALRRQCSEEIRARSVQALSPDAAARCGLIRLPGTPDKLGTFVAQFESGAAEGGYDLIAADPSAGGWTYGKYQLASKAGGISSFLNALLCRNTSRCLDAGYRVIGEALENAGGVQAAQAKLPAFVELWQRLSLEDRRMQQAQESYHVLVVWQPISEFFRSLGIDLATTSCGLRETALSVQTQHSPASAQRIFKHAASIAGTTNQAAFITAANDYRLERLGVPSGYYETYGNQCHGLVPASDADKRYACSYLRGVQSRWEREAVLFTSAPLQRAVCP